MNLFKIIVSNSDENNSPVITLSVIKMHTTVLIITINRLAIFSVNNFLPVSLIVKLLKLFKSTSVWH